ncbi:MAG: nuclear transport factor 2 family protein [Pseudomonadales bacterium]
MLRQTLILALFLLLSACATQTPPASTSQQDLEKALADIAIVRQTMVNAFSNGEVESYLNVLSDDVVFDHWRLPAIQGLEASRALMISMYKRAEFFVSYEPVEVVVNGNFAYDRGVWHERMTVKATGVTTQDAYGNLQMYKRGEDGRWRMSLSIWNRDDLPLK